VGSEKEEEAFGGFWRGEKTVTATESDFVSPQIFRCPVCNEILAGRAYHLQPYVQCLECGFLEPVELFMKRRRQEKEKAKA